MTIRQTPFSKSETKRLGEIMSPFGAIVRALLWVLVVIFAALWAKNINRLTGGLTWWPIPALLAGAGSYWLGVRMSGGRALRSKVRQDLQHGMAEEREFQLTDACMFPEVEDEGPVVFLLSGGRVYCLSGQEVSRQVSGGLIGSKVVEHVAPISKVVLSRKARGNKIPLREAEMSFDDSAVYDRAWLRDHVVEVPLAWDEVLAALVRGTAGIQQRG
jgi:hypothetical protein